MRRTFGPRVIENPGGFGGLFSLDYDTRLFAKNYRHPVLVGCTDGVGTKLKIAFMMDKHDTVGIDLVAMNVNDLVVQGAEPLFFLDYLATGELKPETLVEVIRGVACGCDQAECSLIGGETATMPDFYEKGEYDLAGFAVGVVEKSKLITGVRVEPGNVMVGIHSSGVHSNGFSLVRKLFFGRAKMTVQQHVDELGVTLGEELLRPTRIYVKGIKALFRRYRRRGILRGFAHITGGGLPGNVSRILPKNCSAEIRQSAWERPPIFDLIQKLGKVEAEEMYRVFNMGIGFVIVVHGFFANSIVRYLKKARYEASIIGEIVAGDGSVRVVD